MDIKQLKAHAQLFFTATIVSRGNVPFNRIERAAIGIANNCFIPFHFLLKKVFRSEAVIRFRIGRVIPNGHLKVITLMEVHSEKKAYRIHQMVLAILFVIPGTVLGTAIKLSLYFLSKQFSTQVTMLADHLLMKERNISKAKERSLAIDLLSLPKDIWQYHIRSFLTQKELGRMCRLNKAWNAFCSQNIFWEPMAKNYPDFSLLSGNPAKEQMRSIYSNIQRMCSPYILKVFGSIDKISRLPCMMSDHDLNDKNPILRNSKYSEFIFQCFDAFFKEKFNLVVITFTREKYRELLFRCDTMNKQTSWSEIYKDDDITSVKKLNRQLNLLRDLLAGKAFKYEFGISPFANVQYCQRLKLLS